MATLSQPTTQAALTAPTMRESWTRARSRGRSILGIVGAFFLFHPPLAQGVYFLLRGLWPLFRLGYIGESSATDTDIWLAQGGGVLMMVIGGTLCLAAYRRQGSMEVIALALGSALGLIVLELIFAIQHRISELYLLDVLAQAGLVAFWVYGWRKAEGTRAQAVQESLAVGLAARAAMSQPAVIPMAAQSQPV